MTKSFHPNSSGYKVMRDFLQNAFDIFWNEMYQMHGNGD